MEEQIVTFFEYMKQHYFGKEGRKSDLADDMVRIEARRYGVTIVGSEIIGLVPMEALIDTASYYLGLENFSMQQVLEARIME